MDAVLGQALGEEGCEVIAGADHDLCGLNDAVAGDDPPGFDRMNRDAAAEGHAVGAFEESSHEGDGFARLHPAVMRAVEHRLGLAGDPGEARATLSRGEQLAAFAHDRVIPEGLQHGGGFRAAADDGEAMLQHRDAGSGGDLLPDVAGPHGAAPAVAILLAGDRHEAEIADGGAHGALVAVDDDGAEAQAGRGQGMSKPHDAGADDRDIVCHQGASPAEMESGEGSGAQEKTRTFTTFTATGT